MGDYKKRKGALVHRLANLSGQVELGEGTRVDAFVTLTGNVKIGRHCHISTQACVFGGNGFWMGDYSGLSVGAKVFTSTEDLSGEWMLHPTVPRRFRDPIDAPVSIGSHCSVGAGSILLPGSDMPDGCAIGALSLVKTRLKGWAIYAGVPVRLIRDRCKKALRLQAEMESEWPRG